VEKPRPSWVITSERRGEQQIAYQILVASSEELLKKGTGDLWDSGKVASDQSIAVRYAGAPFASETRYWWKVRVRLSRHGPGEGGAMDGQPTAWSERAVFPTGKMRPDDWRGK
jgi:alpha-L-rhamnosidase